MLNVVVGPSVIHCEIQNKPVLKLGKRDKGVLITVGGYTYGEGEPKCAR